MSRKRIAIVGSGVSGLGALWTLKNTDHEVHLYESESRLGGHTNTAIYKGKSGDIPVDTGFIVMNTATYPNLIAFLKHLKIDTVPTEMTFGISRDQGAFEWAGTSLDAIFAQRENILKPSMWRMIFDIVRFNQSSLDLLTNSTVSPDLTIGEYLDREGYSASFRDDYLIPMTACVWSTGPDKCALEFPAVTLIRFLWNHHLLSTITTRPSWLTIPGGSKRYIDTVLRDFPPDHVHLSSPVTSLHNTPSGSVLLTLASGAQQEYDNVLLATHGNQAHAIVHSSATPTENTILSAFATTPNTAYLHSDLTLMPTRRNTWAAWNYLTTTPSPKSLPDNPAHAPAGALSKVSLTYNMNILQHIPASHGDILVTLNPPHPPAPALTQATYEYAHPLYNPAMVAAQERLAEIQGTRGVWYAGAWTGYGFHEDGFTSGLRAGVAMGGRVAWEGGRVVDSKYSRGQKPVRTWTDHVLRIVLEAIQILIVLVVGMGRARAVGKMDKAA
ncbi:amine oxidase-like protein [Pseudovirgaria hyperparasitica]|uniref:Amine oxidase-like protein n=1 Tax=Pseudovirgaria hyperparasitica TaxID=470096 RepID=A0A6A6WJ96_9PEZI|nr:amine oxidase-like protein [Pseudovirgaria hyperparasitica]KAF2762220.1 amine oxidase-like protein [Pseudovirgaria hyperparasitica]